ncbi:MAG: hypothetical protein JO102_06535, partial [Elusimicrobia bacterium]|nr:hypothetical protein [Elusimicrobiota bacterium]
MKRSSTSTTSGSRSSVLVLALAAALARPSPLGAFKTEEPAGSVAAQTAFERMEAGILEKGKDPDSLFALAAGDYAGALKLLTPQTEAESPWLRPYLEGTIAASKDLVHIEGTHFNFY